MTDTYRALCEELTTTLEFTWDGRRPKAIQELLDRARAALAEQPVAPTPLDNKLPGAEDVNEDGYCWLWDNYERIWDWTYIRTRTKAEMYDYTHWLPANTLPLPNNA
jgi:hypothetical protein